MGKIEIVISSLSIVNSLYIGRKYHSNQLRQSLLGLSKIVSFADMTTPMVLETLQTDWPDYEDALQNATAVYEDCNCIVTRNKKDFDKSALPVYLPEEMLEALIK